MKLSKEGTNELSTDGFDWIALNVIFQGLKGPKRSTVTAIFSKFSQKPFDIFSLFFVHSLLLGDDIDQLSRDGFVWIIRKVIFKVRMVGLTHLPIYQ